MASMSDILDFYTDAPLLELGAEADRVRRQKHPDDVVTFMWGVFPDVHRELLEVHDLGNDLVVVKLLIQGTFEGGGPFPTPAGPLQPNGAKTDVPTVDLFYLRDGKIQQFDCYPMMNIRMAQLGISYDFAAAVNKASGDA